jgi:hypothetical protein
MWLPLSAPAVNVKEFAHGPIQLWLRPAAFAGWKATAGVDRRRNDWAPRSLEGREFEEVIMIASCDRREGWVRLSSGPQRLRAGPGGKAQTHHESEMALCSECMEWCAQIVLDPAVRDGDF